MMKKSVVVGISAPPSDSNRLFLVSQLLLAIAILWVETLYLSLSEDAGGVIRQVTDDYNDELLDAGSALQNAEMHFSKRRFKKTYSREEEHAQRFAIFKRNMIRALEHQKLYSSAVHIITKFFDLIEFEVKERFLSLRGAYSPRLVRSVSANKAPILPTDGLPINFD